MNLDQKDPTRFIPDPNWKKSSFNLSHYKTFSGQIGWIMPVMYMDVVPGDNIQVKTNHIVKFAPLLYPLMHRVDVYTHTFWCPYRLLMSGGYGATQAGWNDYIMGDPESRYTNEDLPYVTINNANKAQFVESSLADFFGLPTIDSGTTVHANADEDINVLWPFAYHLIYDEYYRDPDTQTRQTNFGGSIGNIDLYGGDRNTDIAMIFPTVPLFRNHERDYFHGCLPNAYSGASTDVELDLDVYGGGAGTSLLWADQNDGGFPDAGTPSFPGAANEMDEGGATNHDLTLSNGQQTGIIPTLEIFELRRAEALTRFLEAENRAEHQYYSWLKSVFGVTSDDLRDQIPRYLAGSKTQLNIQEVLNTSAVYDSTDNLVDPQGNQSGVAESRAGGGFARLYAKEHGVIMTLLSVVPRTAYAGGIQRFWSKLDREDFYIPHLQGIGDQAVLSKELCWDADTATYLGNNEFGYNTRWSEYKQTYSTVHGEFRTSLNEWNMANIYDDTDPADTLNSAFQAITYTDDEYTRPFAVSPTTADALYIQVYNDIRAIRPMHLVDIPR